jgi:hypothetical protein
MFRHHEDHKFKKIIDEFILSSRANDKPLFVYYKIDLQAAKLGISFYHMMFILIRKNSIENRKNKEIT